MATSRTLRGEAARWHSLLSASGRAAMAMPPLRPRNPAHAVLGAEITRRAEAASSRLERETSAPEKGGPSVHGQPDEHKMALRSQIHECISLLNAGGLLLKACLLMKSSTASLLGSASRGARRGGVLSDALLVPPPPTPPTPPTPPPPPPPRLLPVWLPPSPLLPLVKFMVLILLLKTP
eukprot:6192805-Pleurochrysis_carterae.AAC.1